MRERQGSGAETVDSLLHVFKVTLPPSAGRMSSSEPCADVQGGLAGSARDV